MNKCKDEINGTCGICRDPEHCPSYVPVPDMTDVYRQILDNAKLDWRDNATVPDVFDK